MEQIIEFFKNLLDRFKELEQGQKMAAIALVVVAVTSLFVMFFWAQAPDMRLLYANLPEEDAAAIVEELRTKQIPYELSAQGKTIRIPSSKVHEVRLELASKGLPQGGEVGMEIFEEPALGMTEFVQKLNYQRALQGELIRTISTLDAIETARVHLVIPEEKVFFKEKPKGKASVTLKMKAGRSLTEAQVQGIVHLVSSSVKGILPGDVAVVDAKGNMLTGAMGRSSQAMIGDTNFKFKRKLEKGLEEGIHRMLEDALGPGKIIARVMAVLNFDQVERTEEIFDPDSQVVRSEQRNTEAVVGAVPPGGIPGVQSLLPAGQNTSGGAGTASRRNNEKQVLNYEINKVVRRVTKPIGEINKLSVSVMIDGVLDENGEYKARTQEEMKTYSDLVKSAIGFDADRGDIVKVENVQFDKSLLLEEQKRIQQAENIELGFQVAKYVLGAIFILLFYTRLVRPLVNWMTTSVEVVDETAALEEAAEAEAEAETEEERQRLAELGPPVDEIRQIVNEFIENDPQFSAGVVRKWLKERKPSE